MRRREFISLIGGAAAWPMVAKGQQPAMPVIGFLHGGSPGPFAQAVAEFRRGLSENGYFEGQNVAIEYRWAAGRYDRVPAMAEELVRRRVAVIVAIPTTPALAAKAATTTIPIVFLATDDPVALGLVAAYNRPGGNATGIANFNSKLEPKRFGLLITALPKATKIALLVNPDSKLPEATIKEVQEAAKLSGLANISAGASTDGELEPAFVSFVAQGASALIVAADTFFISQRDRIVGLAAHYKLPTIYTVRAYATAGGLMSYGPRLGDSYGDIGIYTGRILKGVKPADLPVSQSSRFEFVINLKTAKTLGLEIPYGLILAADEVIE